MAPDVMREMGELIMAEWRGMAPIDSIVQGKNSITPSKTVRKFTMQLSNTTLT
jgi:hypothetical protein